MKVLGIIVEYNPFHLGHLHHLRSSIDLVNPDFTIAVMSGNFVQRGEPSIADKFARTKMALSAGVDVVVELPVIYAIQDASGFAIGSIGTLHLSNVVTDVVFGSESNDVQTLEKISETIVKEPENFRKALKKHLKDGVSFPNARRFAINDILSSEIDAEQMRKSNDILGIEYIAALKKLNSTIKARTVKRKGSDYNDAEMSEMPSATAIRKAISSGDELRGIPEFTRTILTDEFIKGRGPVFLEDTFDFARKKVVILGRNGLETLYGFNEGLSKRFIDAAVESDDAEGFFKSVKTKRFTLTRIRRRLLYAVFDLTRENVTESNEFGPQYIRVLGFSRKGRKLLREISDRASIPLISNVSNFNKIMASRNVNLSLARNQFELDLKATDFYSLLFQKKEERKCGRDFQKPSEV